MRGVKLERGVERGMWLRINNSKDLWGKVGNIPTTVDIKRECSLPVMKSQSHNLTNKKPGARNSFFFWSCPTDPQILQVIANAIVYSPEFDSKDILLKILHTYLSHRILK